MNRIERLRDQLPNKENCILVNNRYNRSWLTEYNCDEGILLITPDSVELFVDFRYIEAVTKADLGVNIHLLKNSWKQIAEATGLKNVVLYLEDSLSLNTYAQIQEAFVGCSFVPDKTLTSVLRNLRAVKDTGELACIKAAQAITEKAFSHILTLVRPGISERDMAAELDYFMRKNGGDDGNAFPTISIAGSKTAMPHGVPSDYIVKLGDLVTMDFGAKKDGYCSDMTRTFAVGQIDSEKKRVYEIVLQAQLAAVAAARPGITGKALDAVARDWIDSAGYKGRFGHSLGHSLGLEIHETPMASRHYQEELPEGTILTIEPGIYLEGNFGIRIENMVYLTGDGAENLTSTSRELLVL